MPQSFIPPTPHPVNAMDLFPELEVEIDRRIAHAEQRIKNWVLVGILTNFIMITAAAIPSVFYLGQLSQNASDALVRIQATRTELDALKADRENRKLQLAAWQTSVEAYLIQRGWHPPRDSR